MGLTVSQKEVPFIRDGGLRKKVTIDAAGPVQTMNSSASKIIRTTQTEQ